MFNHFLVPIFEIVSIVDYERFLEIVYFKHGLEMHKWHDEIVIIFYLRLVWWSFIYFFKFCISIYRLWSWLDSKILINARVWPGSYGVGKSLWPYRIIRVPFWTVGCRPAPLLSALNKVKVQRQWEAHSSLACLLQTYISFLLLLLLILFSALVSADKEVNAKVLMVEWYWYSLIF